MQVSFYQAAVYQTHYLRIFSWLLKTNIRTLDFELSVALGESFDEGNINPWLNSESQSKTYI